MKHLKNILLFLIFLLTPSIASTEPFQEISQLRDPFQPPEEYYWLQKKAPHFSMEATSGIYFFDDLGNTIGYGFLANYGPISEHFNVRFGVNFLETEPDHGFSVPGNELIIDIDGNLTGTANINGSSITVRECHKYGKKCRKIKRIELEDQEVNIDGSFNSSGTVGFPGEFIHPQLSITNLNLMLEHISYGGPMKLVIGAGLDFYTISANGVEVGDAIGARIAGRGIYDLNRDFDVLISLEGGGLGASPSVRGNGFSDKIDLEHILLGFGIRYHFN